MGAPGQSSIRDNTFRGSRRAYISAVFYRHEGGEISASAHVVSFSQSKRLGEVAGRWSLRLKAGPVIGGPAAAAAGPRDWRAELPDDTWVIVQFLAPDAEGGATGGKPPRETRTLIGLVESTTRVRSAGVNGAATVMFDVTGWDWAALVTRVEALSLPVAPFNGALNVGSLYNAAFGISGLKGRSPGIIVELLWQYFLRGATHRVYDPFLEIPNSLPLPTVDKAAGVLSRNPRGRQFSDIVALEMDDLDGYMPEGNYLGSINQSGQRLGEILQRFGNPEMNELIFDLDDWAPTKGGQRDDGVIEVIGSRRGQDVPVFKLRERPFPARDEITADRDAWKRPSSRWRHLPTHDVDARDLTSDELTRSGAERCNFFLATWAGSMGVDRYSAALAALKEGGGTLGMSSVPAVDIPSIGRYGFRKLEVESRYVDASTRGILTLRTWTHLLRDWYGRNHDFLSGSLRIGYLRPEVRIGQRVRVKYPEGGYVLAYVEGVEHTWRVGAGGAREGSTAITVTRGTVNVDHILPALGTDEAPPYRFFIDALDGR